MVQELAFPLTLAGLVPILSPHVSLAGFDADYQDFQNILVHIQQNRFDVIVVSISHQQSSQATLYLKRIKAAAPSVPIICCGDFATCFPDVCLEYMHADIAIVGDPEASILSALDTALDTDCDQTGLVIKTENGLKRVGEAQWINNLDSLPSVDRDLFNISAYGTAYRSERYPFAALTSSRGCGCYCPSCAIPATQTRGFRAMSPERVVSLMHELVNDYGVQDIHFEDDCFFADQNRVSAICQKLIESGFSTKWELVNGIRPEHLPMSLLPDLAKAGCARIALGVETLMLDNRDVPHPMAQPIDRIRVITDAAKKSGIKTTGYFMLGMPGIDSELDARVVKAATRLKFDIIHFSLYTPIQGSE